MISIYFQELAGYMSIILTFSNAIALAMHFFVGWTQELPVELNFSKPMWITLGVFFIVFLVVFFAVLLYYGFKSTLANYLVIRLLLYLYIVSIPISVLLYCM